MRLAWLFVECVHATIYYTIERSMFESGFKSISMNRIGRSLLIARREGSRRFVDKSNAVAFTPNIQHTGGIPYLSEVKHYGIYIFFKDK